MLKKPFTIIFLTLIISLIMSGCSEEDKLNYSIVGGWKTGTVVEKGDTILFFNEDGTAVDRFDKGEISSTGTWELNEKILTLNLTDKDNNEWSFSFKIHFEDKGKLLVAEELSSGYVETWERV